MPPSELHRLHEAALDRHFDWVAYKTALKREEAERAKFEEGT